MIQIKIFNAETIKFDSGVKYSKLHLEIHCSQESELEELQKRICSSIASYIESKTSNMSLKGE
jgi:hypothetical protein